MANVFVEYSGLSVKLVKAALAGLPSASGIAVYEELERPSEMIDVEISAIVATCMDGSELTYYTGAKALCGKTAFFVFSITPLGGGLHVYVDDKVGNAVLTPGFASLVSEIAEFRVPGEVDLNDITVDELAQYLIVGDE